MIDLSYNKKVLSLDSKLYTYLSDVLKDESIDEILMNSTYSILICYNDHSIKEVESIYSSMDELIYDMQNFSFFLKTRLDPSFPINGGVFYIGDINVRWHFVLPPINVDGPLLSFRRHRFDSVDVEGFKNIDKYFSYIEDIFKNNKPLIVCGTTGSGKSSFLFSCLKKWCLDSRVIFVEHILELPLFSSRWVRLVEKISNIDGYGGYGLESIFKEVLRLRPDKIVVGEIRSQEEILVFIEALESGHGGVYTSIHAGNYLQLESRINRILGNKKIEKLEFFQNFKFFKNY